jgi:integrase
MIRVALNTGLRLNAIRTLAWKYVDFNTNTIFIEATNSKNKKPHVIPMNSTVRKLFLENKLRCAGSEYIFPRAMSITSSGISMQFKKLCRKLRIQGLRFHDLRHTAVTRMIESGIGIDKVSKILGHANIQMTMRYSHPDNSLREAVETLANFKNSTTNIATNENLNISN